MTDREAGTEPALDRQTPNPSPASENGTVGVYDRPDRVKTSTFDPRSTPLWVAFALIIMGIILTFAFIDIF